MKREIKIKNTKNEADFRVITQVQTINWPDYLEPEKETGYNTLEQLLIQIQESICYNPKSPILMHCRYLSIYLIYLKLSFLFLF